MVPNSFDSVKCTCLPVLPYSGQDKCDAEFLLKLLKGGKKTKENSDICVVSRGLMLCFQISSFASQLHPSGGPGEAPVRFYNREQPAPTGVPALPLVSCTCITFFYVLFNINTGNNGNIY